MEALRLRPMRVNRDNGFWEYQLKSGREIRFGDLPELDRRHSIAEIWYEPKDSEVPDPSVVRGRLQDGDAQHFAAANKPERRWSAPSGSGRMKVGENPEDLLAIWEDATNVELKNGSYVAFADNTYLARRWSASKGPSFPPVSPPKDPRSRYDKGLAPNPTVAAMKEASPSPTIAALATSSLNALAISGLAHQTTLMWKMRGFYHNWPHWPRSEAVERLVLTSFSLMAPTRIYCEPYLDFRRRPDIRPVAVRDRRAFQWKEHWRPVMDVEAAEDGQVTATQEPRLGVSDTQSHQGDENGEHLPINLSK